MNYARIYEELIAYRQTGEVLKRGGTERHHVVPKSWGGTNEPTNLVYLTLREHFIAHLLLVKIADTERKRHQMLATVIRMSKGTRQHGGWTRGICNGRRYQLLRSRWLAAHRRFIYEQVGSNGESRVQLMNRRSAAKMASTVINGKTIAELRAEHITVHNTEARTWERSSGEEFTGTAFELTRRYPDHHIEASKLTKYDGTTRRHRGWRVKLEHQVRSTKLAARYPDVRRWVHVDGRSFNGTCYELACSLNQGKGIYSNRFNKAAHEGKPASGWSVA